jgi:4-hydroxy-tetrahydrodipicolinate synthase
MEPDYPALQGVWLPLITPFREGVLDEVSLRRCILHFGAQPIDGLILAATTGEGLTLDDEEAECLVSVAADELANTGTRMPVYPGLSRSLTEHGNA